MDERRPDFIKMAHNERLRPQEEMLEVARRKSSLTIGVPKEICFQENRVPLVPDGISLLYRNGHRVLVEAGAGDAAHFSDHDFSEAGGEIVYSPQEVYTADMILKVAPLSKEEIELVKPKQAVASSLQIVMQDEEYFRSLMQRKITALAFEWIRDKAHSLMVTRAMSEIAGSTAVYLAVNYLADPEYGRGTMFGGFTGIPPSEVVIIGAGTVGEFAARSARGLGAFVKIFDNSVYRLRRIQENLGARTYTSILHPQPLVESLKTADVVICALHSKEGKTPCIITEEMVKKMKEGSVIIDVSIDQGGCFETSHPTTHKNPVFKVHGVTHYCVPNIPSKVPHTASQALSNIFVPIILNLGSEGGLDNLLRVDAGVRHGVYIYNGTITNQYLSKHFNLPFQDIDLLMAALH